MTVSLHMLLKDVTKFANNINYSSEIFLFKSLTLKLNYKD